MVVLAWARQGRRVPAFAINASAASTGVCDAMAVEESPLWRYVKHELNTLAWATLIVVTFLLVRRLYAVLRIIVMGYRLPGPHARALNGQSKCLSKAQAEPQMLQGLLATLHQEHGPVVKLWTGPAQLLVSVKDVHFLQHMLERAKDRVPAPRMALQLVYGQRSLFFSKYSNASQEARLRLEKEVNGGFLREAHKVLVKVAGSVTKWAKPAGNGSWEVDCSTFSRMMAFAALGTSLYGDGYLTSPVAREFEDVMVAVAEELPTWMPYSVPPLWNPKFNEFRIKCQRLRALATQLVANGKKQFHLLESDVVVGDEAGSMEEVLVSSLFSTLGCVELTSVSNPQASGIMSHGSFNTARVLNSVLVQLAQHPHIQAKVHDEILMVSGSSNPPAEGDMKRMAFLTATVCEAARLLPTAAPFLQRCSVDHDVELQPGVIVPAGATLAAPVQLVHQDGVYWGEDANIFNPDRFLKASTIMKAGEQFRKGNHDDLQKSVEGHSSSCPDLNLDPGFLVFGAGSRSCIGSNLALKQISTLVAVILQRFELKEISDQCVETSEGKRIVLSLSPR